ncbi:MAG: hypothetical protein Q9162_006637 [Coniocarpon cinnabarinum]
MVSELPLADSRNLALVHPTEGEQHEQTLENSKMWKGALALDSYIRREQHLANLQLTRDGGITFWVLVDASGDELAGSNRSVLAGCETLKKRALVVEGNVLKDATCHGVASVFSPDRYRGKGYGKRMISELAKHLAQKQQTEGHPHFSILYSDIGKKFYAKSDWRPYSSSHMQLPPLPSSAPVTVRLPESMPLTASALPPLCALDEELLRAKLSKIAASGSATKPVVALIPDAATLAWLHAREDFVAEELFGKTPAVKGAQVLIPDPSSPMGKRRAWGVWTRFWYNADMTVTQGNTLHLLRICIEPANSSSDLDAEFVENTQAIMSVLHQAQLQAGEWGMNEVEVWNPQPATQQAVKLLAADWSTQGGTGVGDKWGIIVDRDEESICSLKWFGDHTGSEGGEVVEWLENEKFGWN